MLQGPESWHPAPGPLKEAVKKSAELASSQGVDITTLAVKDSMRGCPGVTVHLMGMCTPEEVQADVKIALEALGLVDCERDSVEQQVLQEVKKILEPVMNTTWPVGKTDNRK